MTTHQPASLRPSSPERYEEISRHLLRQAEEELDKGDALQASEKIWGATAHALKAIAQDRGWNHRFHNHLRAAASYLAIERGRTDWHTTFDSLDSSHTNYYEHQRFVSQVRATLELAKNYCQELEGINNSPAPQNLQLTPNQESDQANFLRTLTRPISERSSFGPQYTPEEETELPPVSPTQL